MNIYDATKTNPNPIMPSRKYVFNHMVHVGGFGMSYWKTVLENEISNIKTFNYQKINVTQQEIADLFQKNEFSVLEVSMLLEGMKKHIMLNKENTLELHKVKNSELYKIENVNQYD